MILNWAKHVRYPGTQTIGAMGGVSILITYPVAFTQATVRDTQLAVEDIEATDPTTRLTQMAVEDIESVRANIRVTQMVVEILIPFSCSVTPPPGPVPPTSRLYRRVWALQRFDTKIRPEEKA